MKGGRLAAGAALAFFATAPLGRCAEDKPLILVSQKIPYARIVVADRPDPIGLNTAGWRLDCTRSTRYAAEFLQRYLERVTGVTVPIVPESLAGDRPAILVGRSKLTAFVEADRAKLPPEGFIIRRSGRHIAIVGEIAPDTDLQEYRGADRGTLFGVFEFLERCAGVRWYFPNELGVVIPTKTHLAVTQIDVTRSPYYPMRTGAVYPDAAAGEFGEVLPVIRPGNTTGFHANHTCYHWYKYVKTDPEAFAVGPDGERMVDPAGPGGNKANHLCYSSPRTLEIELNEIREYDRTGARYTDFSLLPSEKYVRCVPKDIENIYHCHCEACRSRWTPDRENSKLSDVVFGYMAKLAGEIDRDQPGRRLATLSYCGFLYPPEPTVKIPDNLDVMVCTVKGNMKLVAPGHWRHSLNVIDRWHETLGRDPRRLFLFEYLVYPSVEAPALYPHTLQRWFQALRGKVSGGFNNGMNAARSDRLPYRFSLLNGWLWHKLLWDPDADVPALLNGWYADLFGPAAKPMGELFTLTIDAWEQAPWGDGLNAGAVSHVPEKFLFQSVYPPATIQTMKTLLEAGRQAATNDLLCARRVTYFGEAYDDFFAKAAAFHQANRPPPRLDVQRAASPLPVSNQPNGDETVWNQAPAIELRGQKLGDEPPVASSVRILCHDQVLYLAGTLGLPDGAQPVTNGLARDDAAVLTDDRLEIDFDLRDDDPLALRSFYRIAVNAAGIVCDGVKFVPVVVENLHHAAWVDDWHAADLRADARRGAGHWQARLAIPLKAFPEYARRPRRELRVQIRHVRRAKPSAVLAWSPTLHETYDVDLDRFGTLVLPADG